VGGVVEYSFATQSGSTVRRVCGGRGGVCQPEHFKKQLALAKEVRVWHDLAEVFQVRTDGTVLLEIARFNSARWFPQVVALVCAFGFLFNIGLRYGFINGLLADQPAEKLHK
jgi:hypothetical protein